MAVKDERDQAMMAATLRAIGRRLFPQLPPKSVLFLSDEIGELKKQFPGTQTNFPTI